AVQGRHGFPRCRVPRQRAGTAGMAGGAAGRGIRAPQPGTGVAGPAGWRRTAGGAGLVRAVDHRLRGHRMFNNFRQAMAWLHTWFGLVLGFVLMAAFFFGALSVFDREIDRWALPATRFEPQPMPSFENVLRPAFERLQPDPALVDAMRPRVD